jgi:EAL domain-containing protein (putative c-di-GMP-specific phosphodiesterase class I)
VETESQLGALQRLGCDEAQGHAVGRPLIASELAIWLRARPEIG